MIFARVTFLLIYIFLCFTDCSCHLPGTLYANSSVCDEVTGQCTCNAAMNVDGPTCDICKENTWNASVGISDCRGA
jgi:hypothetical protein